MGAPSIYVYDCSNAGIIVESFQQFADQHEKEYEVYTQILLEIRNIEIYAQDNYLTINHLHRWRSNRIVQLE